MKYTKYIIQPNLTWGWSRYERFHSIFSCIYKRENVWIKMMNIRRRSRKKKTQHTNQPKEEEIFCQPSNIQRTIILYVRYFWYLPSKDYVQKYVFKISHMVYIPRTERWYISDYGVFRLTIECVHELCVCIIEVNDHSNCFTIVLV